MFGVYLLGAFVLVPLSTVMIICGSFEQPCFLYSIIPVLAFSIVLSYVSKDFVTLSTNPESIIPTPGYVCIAAATLPIVIALAFADAGVRACGFVSLMATSWYRYRLWSA